MMKARENTIFCLGMMFALAVVAGCMAKFPGPSMVMPTLTVGEQYRFRGAGELAVGTVTATGPGAWVQIQTVEGGVIEVNLEQALSVELVP